MALNIPPKQIAHTDVDKVKILGQHLGLSPLAASLNSHNDILVHGVARLSVGENVTVYSMTCNAETMQFTTESTVA